MILSGLAHRFIASPNIEPRRNARSIDMLIVHYTGMPSAEAACAWLCNPQSGVSCHYMVCRDGLITQMVGEEMRAWHAGASFWAGETDTNSRSIGIEVDNPGHAWGYVDFPEAQMAAVISLMRDILSRHDIAQQCVLAHSDVAPGRKIDPGERFDWKRLSEEGIGHWVPPAAPDGSLLDGGETAELQQLLQDYGYGIEVTGQQDEQTRKVLDAFQRHFRQAKVDGLADRSTLETARCLVHSLRQRSSRP